MRFLLTIITVIASLVVLAALAGCATLIDEHRPPPKGWPILTVRDHVVGGLEVIQRCSKYTPWYWWPPMACVEIDFDARTCDIWRAWDATPDMIEHELMHCAGGQHPGDDTLTEAWRAYQQTTAGKAVAKAVRNGQ